jgi:hypothetical protein
MCAGAGQTPVIDDQILVADRAAVEPAFEDFARAYNWPTPSSRSWPRATTILGATPDRRSPRSSQ